ncbi:cupredoxin domain-containing protein [Rhodalgimonas zhirmunskyi]|uniref:Cupredoxin domain-containing protein n=1 Tax=Rhodalgimonas zhirmunskyi TaxID=2964767 RepID=A0AAJ1U5X0_9RHOB|nr:cupredoxin domain-containing protein [Rhodoalgimonas zhirmunskyi]MDQ2093710.1 cupredoxin domain-containing protein [Rhodoalgimonas zhirmunskyi]
MIRHLDQFSRPSARKGLVTGFVTALLAALWLGAAQAETAPGDVDATGFTVPLDPDAAIPTYLVELNDGALLPETLIVPAKTRFRIQVRNIGTKPSEFESNQMRLEEVLFMGAEATMMVTPLDPGEYDYFDEFQPGVMGKLTAKEAEQ